ncbi:MAG: thermonuclease family protein [Candidatus Brocadiae bacterium]|nr:thermonuclease family protein [Candidatus Brocadiia bacterium]
MSGRANRRLVTGLLVGLFLAGLLTVVRRAETRRPGASPSDRGPFSPRPSAVAGAVTHVYDGDTIEVSGVGKVRLIGIDAMDGHNADRMSSQSQLYGLSSGEVRRWAKRAADFARHELKGRRVVLHHGREGFDAYGRTLAYVHLPTGGTGGGDDFNLRMLKAGLAAAYRRAEHPRREDYLRAEQAAQDERVGMWTDARIQP